MPRGRPRKEVTVTISNTEGVAILPETKEKNGYHYVQVTRSDKAAVYKMVNTKEPTDNSTHYEVFRILISPAEKLCGLLNSLEAF